MPEISYFTSFMQVEAPSTLLWMGVQSDSNTSKRQRIAAMLYDGINQWIRPLWDLRTFLSENPVSVVGWAVQNENLILDRQPNEIIWLTQS